jgi:hypothetical protein
VAFSHLYLVHRKVHIKGISKDKGRYVFKENTTISRTVAGLHVITMYHIRSHQYDKGSHRFNLTKFL